MKHRSPLYTLAAVALAFIIMFTVDVLAGPPGGNSAEPAATSVPPAVALAEWTSAPGLDPENPQVTVNDKSLDAQPVNGNEEL